LVMAAAVVIDLLLLTLEVEVEPGRLRVIENDLPLIELRAVVMELRVARDEWPDVVAIAPRVVGQEGERVEALRREVVERADEALSLAALPCGVAGPPIANVRRPGLERSAGLIRPRAVEVGIGKERLGRIRSRFEEALARPRESQIAFADVLESPPGSQVATCLVARRDRESAFEPMRRRHGLAVRLEVERDARSAHEFDAIGPFTFAIGSEVRAPSRPGVGRGLGGVPVRGEVAGNDEPNGAPSVRERHRHAVVGERVRLAVALASEGAFDRERELVPDLLLTRDLDSGDVCAARLLGRKVDVARAERRCEPSPVGHGAE